MAAGRVWRSRSLDLALVMLGVVSLILVLVVVALSVDSGNGRSGAFCSCTRRRSCITHPGSTTFSDCRPAPTTTVAFSRSSST